MSEKDTPKLLKELALKHGFQWGTQENTGKLLDAIASGELTINNLSQGID